VPTTTPIRSAWIRLIIIPLTPTLERLVLEPLEPSWAGDELFFPKVTALRISTLGGGTSILVSSMYTPNLRELSLRGGFASKVGKSGEFVEHYNWDPRSPRANPNSILPLPNHPMPPVDLMDKWLNLGSLSVHFQQADPAKQFLLSFDYPNLTEFRLAVPKI